MQLSQTCMHLVQFSANMLVLSFFLLVVSVQAFTQTTHRFVQRSLNGTQASCAGDPSWDNTQSAWQQANTDSFLKTLLANTTNVESFDRALGRRYGAHYPSFKCGIGLSSTCPLPACSDYQSAPDDKPAYLATVSTVHLATKFNILHTAITNGQIGYYGVIDDLADKFFDWKDPVFVGDDVALWVVAAVTVLCSAVTLGAASPAVIGIGVGAFLGAAVQETTLSLTPPQGATRSGGIAFLKKTSSQLGQSGRDAIEVWTNTSLSGARDSSGRTIVDYFQGGDFMPDVSLPSAAQAERFYKSWLISNTINAQWRTRANFLMFASTTDRNGAYGPAETRYYSEAKQGIYNLYNFDNGKLQAPSGLSLLNETTYGIAPGNITKSSARSWEAAGNNYTDSIAISRIQESFRSNGTLNPYRDGPAWEGMFTLPVCDVGTHTVWLTEYGGRGLPCCCGPNCTDTKSFIRAANLNTSHALYFGCKDLLKVTGQDFDSIDHGIDMTAYTFADKWKYEFSTVQKAFITIGFILAAIVGGGLLLIIGSFICFCFMGDD